LKSHILKPNEQQKSESKDHKDGNVQKGQLVLKQENI
jgi:hypothetical protein